MVLFFLLFISNATFGFETDNYTCRYANLEDVTSQLNEETNRRIQEVLQKGMLDFDASQLPGFPMEIKKKEKSNRPKPSEEASRASMESLDAEQSIQPEIRVYKQLTGCDRTELHSALRGALASSWMGNLESWAEKQPFSKCLPDPNIYSGAKKSGIVLRAVGINYTLKIGGVNIGADKLSHFMTEGADYYEAQLEGKSLQLILGIGEKEELGPYGLRSTGVKSYGDLAANYQGYQFWKNTTEGKDPYFKCIKNKWVQAKDFNWGDFVNPLMDESINCSGYQPVEFKESVEKNIAALQKKHGAQPLSCPLDREACRKASEYIPNEEVRLAIVHPDCLNVEKATEEIKGENHETVR